MPKVKSKVSIEIVLDYLRLFRYRQWSKNLAVLVGPLASGVFFNPSVAWSATLTFCGFSLISSFVYIVNDLVDIEFDRQHGLKKNRPLASEKISKKNGKISAGIVFSLGFLLLNFVSFPVLMVGVVYVLNSLVYSFKLKKIPVLDVVAVSFGFILRGLAGVLCIPDVPTVWFFLLSLFASLLLISGKRFSELNTIPSAGPTRQVLELYSADYLKFIIDFSSAGLITSYGLMAFARSTEFDSLFSQLLIQFSVIPFLITLMLLVLAIYQNKGEVPENFIFDKKVLLFSFVWLLTFMAGIYLVA